MELTQLDDDTFESGAIESVEIDRSHTVIENEGIDSLYATTEPSTPVIYK